MPVPFRKVLIANRGEIAVRIIQTCRQLGILSVAVYSTADLAALHVQAADEAFCLGPPAASESYLNIDALMRVARESDSEAVHPGYGFLAENPRFAAAVAEAGLTWIGPPADVIALMGDKVAAKALADSVGVPIVPGYAGEDQTTERFQIEAERIGYPVLLKAAAGGGGRGMRSVAGPQEMAAALEGAQREAVAAFGSDRMFLEKLIVNPRHVEIQVLLDIHGNGVHLGERDCSLQRRHQKIVEESPSPILTPTLRAAMGRDALRLARAGGYANAGTVEFLFSGDRYYFLEMNTRIQVEHPVTEMVTGLDLVRLQLEIAGGEPLTMSQLDVRLEGHAIEARIYAENPAAGFLPATGRLSVFRPPEGPGIRNDVGVYEGDDVTPYYDPLLAKLIVHADNRDRAVARLRQALGRYGALGTTTNLDFLLRLMERPEVETGRADITFVENGWHLAAEESPPEEVIIAAALRQVHDDMRRPSERADRYNAWDRIDGWTNAPFRTVLLGAGEDEWTVRLTIRGEDSWDAQVVDHERRLTARTAGPGSLVLHEGPRVMHFWTAHTPGAIEIGYRGRAWRFTVSRSAREMRGQAAHRGGTETPTAPMPGTVVKVGVRPGQRVAAHEPLVVLEAMKMEHVVAAPRDGTISAVLVKEGDMVPAGSALVEYEVP